MPDLITFCYNIKYLLPSITQLSLINPFPDCFPVAEVAIDYFMKLFFQPNVYAFLKVLRDEVVQCRTHIH